MVSTRRGKTPDSIYAAPMTPDEPTEENFSESETGKKRSPKRLETSPEKSITRTRSVSPKKSVPPKKAASPKKTASPKKIASSLRKTQARSRSSTRKGPENDLEESENEIQQDYDASGALEYLPPGSPGRKKELRSIFSLPDGASTGFLSASPERFANSVFGEPLKKNSNRVEITPKTNLNSVKRKAPLALPGGEADAGGPNRPSASKKAKTKSHTISTPAYLPDEMTPDQLPHGTFSRPTIAGHPIDFTEIDFGMNPRREVADTPSDFYATGRKLGQGKDLGMLDVHINNKSPYDALRFKPYVSHEAAIGLVRDLVNRGPRILNPYEASEAFQYLQKATMAFTRMFFSYTVAYRDWHENLKFDSLTKSHPTFVSYTTFVAESQYGWPQLLTHPTSRSNLAYALIGKAWETYIFEATAFGIKQNDIDEIEDMERSYIHWDGFSRTKKRASMLASALAKHSRHDTKDDVQAASAQLTFQIIALLTPLLEPYQKGDEAAFPIPSTHNLYRNISNLTLLAARLSLSLRLTGVDGTIFQFSSPTKGSPYQYPQVTQDRGVQTLLNHPECLLNMHHGDRTRINVTMPCFPGVTCVIPHGNDMHDWDKSRDALPTGMARVFREHDRHDRDWYEEEVRPVDANGRETREPVRRRVEFPRAWVATLRIAPADVHCEWVANAREGKGLQKKTFRQFCVDERVRKYGREEDENLFTVAKSWYDGSSKLEKTVVWGATACLAVAAALELKGGRASMLTSDSKMRKWSSETFRQLVNGTAAEEYIGNATIKIGNSWSAGRELVANKVDTGRSVGSSIIGGSIAAATSHGASVYSKASQMVHDPISNVTNETVAEVSPLLQNVTSLVGSVAPEISEEVKASTITKRDTMLDMMRGNGNLGEKPPSEPTIVSVTETEPVSTARSVSATGSTSRAAYLVDSWASGTQAIKDRAASAWSEVSRVFPTSSPARSGHRYVNERTDSGIWGKLKRHALGQSLAEVQTDREVETIKMENGELRTRTITKLSVVTPMKENSDVVEDEKKE